MVDEEKPRLSRDLMAARVASEFQDGWIVNLGVGMPTLCSDFVVSGRRVIFHSENGVIGYGRNASPDEVDPHIVNALLDCHRRQHPGLDIDRAGTVEQRVVGEHVGALAGRECQVHRPDHRYFRVVWQNAAHLDIHGAAAGNVDLIIPADVAALKLPVFQLDNLSHPMLGMNDPVTDLEGRACCDINSAAVGYYSRRGSGGNRRRCALHAGGQRLRSTGARRGYNR